MNDHPMADAAPTEASGFSFDAFLSYGFRPFFLFAGLYGAIAMAAWLAWIAIHAAGGAVVTPTSDLAPHVWHAHEMVFGYTLAVIAGFFLTAVPSWTGSKPVKGLPLGSLAMLWLAGRGAIWFSAHLPPLLVAVIDTAFVPALLVLVARALLKGWSKRNLVFLPVLGGLFACNGAVHLERLGVLTGMVPAAHHMAILIVALLIVVLGGRVVPAFTMNALKRQGETLLPTSPPLLERAGILSLVALIVAELTGADAAVIGGLSTLAALTNGLRLARWRGGRTLGQPIVWVLHLGFALVVLGLAAKAWAAFDEGVAVATAMHLLTVGGIGTMTVAIMSRASLGHTGRVIEAPGLIVAVYVLIPSAALVRLLGPLALPAYYNELMLTAALLWITAFALFSWVFWPILTRPRRRTGAPSEAA